MTTVAIRAASGAHHECDSAAARAAVRYAERAWPVLPGSVYDGRRYVVAGTHRIADGLRPVLPRDQASIDPRTVAAWWHETTSSVRPSVLLRTGRSFDAVAVSRELAIAAIQTTMFRDQPGPVILRPDEGRAYFLIGLGESVLPPEGARPTVVEPVPPGAWLAAPPTRTAVGGVAWLVPPLVAAWTPTNASVLAASLREALPRVESAGWNGISG